MKGLKEQLKRRASLAAFAAAAIVFGLLSLAGASHAQGGNIVRIPLMKRFVPAGARVSPSDIRWVAEPRLRPFHWRLNQRYARVPLFAGQVLSPAELDGIRGNWVLVAVSPTNGVGAGVASPGGSVDVVITHNQRVVWQSGTVAVVGLNLNAGAAPSVSVALSMSQAMAFEREKSSGSITLVGIGS